jgi:hypothetical protein
MARRWTDPRDGTAWIIDATPFDVGPSESPGRAPQVGWTMMFSSRDDHRGLPVGYEVGVNVSKLGDPELIALLDAAYVGD